MDVRTVIKASSFIFAGFFSMSANAALITLDETDVLGVFPGNDADASFFENAALPANRRDEQGLLTDSTRLPPG